MKTIITGSVIFVVWSTISTYYYVCQIKEMCLDQPVEQAQVVKEESVKVPKVESVPEPVKKLDPPGSFTVFHEFDQSQFIQNEELAGYIQDLSAYLNQDESSKISVVGYTDNIGSTKYNYELGLKRATFTGNHMANNVVEESRITFSSQGESSPIATNETSAGRAQNRRTEIKITN